MNLDQSGYAGRVFDPVQLKSFLMVAETGGFTSAGRRLGLQQSTVSQHVRRLEEAAGRRLFLRDTRSVELTAEGEVMLGFARSILDTNERAARYFTNSPVRGRLRFGASEDLVVSELPHILRSFRRAHPMVDLELTVELSGILHEQLAAGALDLVLAKRLGEGDGGRLVWREPLAWAAAEDFRLEPGQPVPIIVYPPPSITRARVIEVLGRSKRPWHIACTSGSLSGLTAAALAGLGVMAHVQGLVPQGLRPVKEDLPPLGDTEFVLSAGRAGQREPGRTLAEAILANGDRLRRGGR
ncbi:MULTISPECIES: LysR substrate-binding domain-containing protein [Arthrobacter]|uniref:LysR family transcriptional regulator n=1 Tax=Arthrobacter TaxID=1663 RepID=UPI00197AEA79|nr:MULTISPECIES: LysR substrate-binding domain-containing protein [Arthrobacter]MBT8162238.1 LysR family transcriptional regulator [Arthrobacter sp. GN70]